MEELINQINAACDSLKAEIAKPSKAAHARARKITLELEKLGKVYRRVSIAEEK